VVVKDWDDLAAKKDLIPGKIVCYSYQWTRYGVGVDYRYDGASMAAKYGAVAALVRSVAPSSISSVHTGNMHYDENFPKIPIAAITVEDSDMFLRMTDRRQTIRVNLQLDSETQNGTNSSNLVF
jgi:carboxypeptidase Q